MRTSLAALLLLVVPACLTNEISGVGDGTGDDDGKADGSGSGSDMGTPTGSPRLAAAFDKATLSTENGKTETLTLNIVSSGGFSGDVQLSKSLVDGSNAAIAGVTVDGPASVTLAPNGTATATFTITLPSNTAGDVINGSMKVSLASSAGPQTATSAVTINNVYTVDYVDATGVTDTNHAMHGMSIAIKRGTILRFLNHDTITHVIHGGGTFTADHEDPATGGLPGRVYDVQTIGYPPGSTGQLGCHTHGTGSYATFTLQ